MENFSSIVQVLAGILLWDVSHRLGLGLWTIDILCWNFVFSAIQGLRKLKTLDKQESVGEVLVRVRANRMVYWIGPNFVRVNFNHKYEIRLDCLCSLGKPKTFNCERLQIPEKKCCG